jgi:protein-export membrane protein SecD
VVATQQQRLIVEIPGVTDVEAAVAMIGETPQLVFKKERPASELAQLQEVYEEYEAAILAGEEVENPLENESIYVVTDLTGRFLQRAAMEFDQTTGQPYVALKFDDKGAELFGEITEANIGKTIAIYLDEHLGNTEPITAPVVRDAITSGEAVITGNFTVDEVKLLVGRLNSGALPVDRLELLSTQSIGPSLGQEAFDAGIVAGLWGLALVAIFFVAWYRLPGFIAVVALGTYLAVMLALFKVIPVTLTAAGIAGFILSIGMAVDANVLIFERLKEELRNGRRLPEAIEEGFARAWLSIRDGNMSSIITAIILFWFGTSLVEGFALTFGVGIMISMLSAITITRTLLRAVAGESDSEKLRELFNSGPKSLKPKA